MSLPRWSVGIVLALSLAPAACGVHPQAQAQAAQAQRRPSPVPAAQIGGPEARQPAAGRAVWQAHRPFRPRREGPRVLLRAPLRQSEDGGRQAV